MADKKISELVSLAGVDLSDADLVPVVDVSTAEAKAVSISGIKAAFAATFSSQAQTEIYTTEALGRAAVADGQAFKVQGSGDVAAYEFRRIDASTSVLIATYPAASAVQKPAWAGKKNGWPDPFFRHIDIRGSLGGRARWYMQNASADAKLSLVAGSTFDGRVLRRSNTAGANDVGGPRIYIDEIGAAPGDTITVRALIVGSGANAVFASRPQNQAGAFLGPQFGEAFTATSTPTLSSVTFTLPADSYSVAIYPYTSTVGQGFDVIALWAYKGAAASGPAWPSFGEDEFFALKTIYFDVSADTISSLSRSVDVVTTGARTDGISVTLGTTVFNTEADGYTGFGQIFTTPVSFSSNACYIGGVPRGVTTKKWTKIKVVLRTHATDVSLPGATIVAVGELGVDQNTAPLGTLYIPWRDPATGALKTVTQAELLAQYGVAFQAWADDSIKATAGQQRATTITGASKLTSHYLTTADAATGGWAAYSGNPSFAIAAIGFDSISQDDVYLLSDAVKADVLEGVDAQSPLPYSHTGRLRKFRSVAYLRMQPTPEVGLRIALGLIGDSWSNNVAYYMQRLARSLVAKIGDGGVGFIGFGFTSGSMALDARGLYFNDAPLTNWTSNYHDGSTSPNISDARSSSAGALIKVSSGNGATHSALSAVKLHFTGTADGVIRWRWNGGAWSANTNVQGGVGAQQTLDLIGFPTAALSGAVARAISLEIEVVSGSVILCGADFQSATAGIVIHKLGSSGSSASHWVTSATAEWRAGIAALGLDTTQILLGTNDQAYGVQASTFAEQMGIICAALKTAIPSMDVLFTVPPENPAGYPTPMSSYATAMVSQAVSSKAALLNLQPAFGDATNPAEYASSGALPLFIDLAHPNVTGSGIVGGEIENVLLWK